MINKKTFSQKLKTEIIRLKKLQDVVHNKNPQYTFLDPTINNAITHLVDLDIYLSGKNLYYKGFDQQFMEYRQIGMNRSFFNQFHIDVEDGLKEIIKRQNFAVRISRKELAESIVKDIQGNIPDKTSISSYLDKIIKLGGDRPSFNDHLHAVLKNTPKLNNNYLKRTVTFMDALNIIRNKISHPDEPITNEERSKLIKAGFKKAIAADGTLQMSFEHYVTLLTQIINFFDTINAHL